MIFGISTDPIPVFLGVVLVHAEDDQLVVEGGAVLDPVQQRHILALPAKRRNKI